MAKMPAAAPMADSTAPMDDSTDPNAPDQAGAADDQGDGSDDADGGPTVLLTVMDNHDGTYQLIQGDEDDDSEGAESAGAADTTGDDTGAGDMAGASAAPEQQGTTYDSPGALLKGILDLVKKSEDEAGGGAQDNFAAGFAGGSSASPAKAPAQKY